MTTPEMHVWFRQYAQEMGMQNVRAILPEQIDLLINTSITDTVNRIINQHIGITSDKVVASNSKLGQINALQPLYKTIEFPISKFNSNTDTNVKIYKSKFNYAELNIPYMYLLTFAINYKKGSKVTNWFPIRIIDDGALAESLNDYILKPRITSPICVLVNNGIEVYIDKVDDKNRLPLNYMVNQIRVSYIKTPNIVKYSDDETEVVNCDLPDSLHTDILKHAVDLYRISISGALSGSQQNQVQQREPAPNGVNQ